MEPPTIMVFAPPRRTQVIVDWMVDVAGGEEVIVRAQCFFMGFLKGPRL